MSDLSVKRTLVKSPPELWSELSEVESLARHLGEFGEISITRLEPEHTVAWEGENARGTVELEASGWGTKVTLSAALGSEPEPEPEPAPVVTSVARESWLRRWVFRERSAAPIVPAPTPEPIAAPDPESERAEAVLEATLDSLGAAHHRPFSREG